MYSGKAHSSRAALLQFVLQYRIKIYHASLLQSRMYAASVQNQEGELGQEEEPGNYTTMSSVGE